MPFENYSSVTFDDWYDEQLDWPRNRDHLPRASPLNILPKLQPRELSSPVSLKKGGEFHSRWVDMSGLGGLCVLCPVERSDAGLILELSLSQSTEDGEQGEEIAHTPMIYYAETAGELDARFLGVDVFQPRQRFLRAELKCLAGSVALGRLIGLTYISNPRRGSPPCYGLAAGNSILAT